MGNTTAIATPGACDAPQMRSVTDCYVLPTGTTPSSPPLDALGTPPPSPGVDRDVDCEGQVNFATNCTPCSTTGNLGKRKQFFVETKSKSGQGKTCTQVYGDITTRDIDDPNCKCPTACVVNNTSAWSLCSATCGGGERTRTITLTKEATDGGACAAIEGATHSSGLTYTETEPCGTAICNKDCIGEFVPVTPCPADVKCTRGSEAPELVESYQITQAAEGTGKACPFTTGKIKKTPCPASAGTCNSDGFAADCDWAGRRVLAYHRKERPASEPSTYLDKTELYWRYSNVCNKFDQKHRARIGCAADGKMPYTRASGVPSGRTTLKNDKKLHIYKYVPRGLGSERHVRIAGVLGSLTPATFMADEDIDFKLMQPHPNGPGFPKKMKMEGTVPKGSCPNEQPARSSICAFEWSQQTGYGRLPWLNPSVSSYSRTNLDAMAPGGNFSGLLNKARGTWFLSRGTTVRDIPPYVNDEKSRLGDGWQSNADGSVTCPANSCIAMPDLDPNGGNYQNEKKNPIICLRQELSGPKADEWKSKELADPNSLAEYNRRQALWTA